MTDISKHPPLAEAQARRAVAIARGDIFTAGLMTGIICAHIAFGGDDLRHAAPFDLQWLLDTGHGLALIPECHVATDASIDADERFLVTL